jgi:hypothetical protein
MARGGAREGAGRKKGSGNKATAAIKEYAQKHSEDAIKAIVNIMNDKYTPAQTKLAAANSLLDRGHGRPAQAVTNEDGSKLFPDNIKVTIVKP